MDKELKAKITAFLLKHGRNKAEGLLCSRGLTRSFVQKILAGKYDHQPIGLQLKALEEGLSL